MPITFHVLRSELDPDRGELLVTGTVSEGILVTGMIATGGGRRAAVQELETVTDDDHGQVFRLTFTCGDAEAGAGWREAWGAGTEVALAY